MESIDDDYDEDYMLGGQMFQFRSEGKNDPRDAEIREQDRYLPIANIARIMKKVLPGNAKIAKDAKESIQECVSEFISFITSEASERCITEKRKTINGDDLLWAMSTLGFEKYIEPLKAYLAKYRESVKGERVADKKPVVRRDLQVASSIPFQSNMSQMKASHLVPIQSYQTHGSGPIMSLTPAPIKSEYASSLMSGGHKWSNMPPLTSSISTSGYATSSSTHASSQVAKAQTSSHATSQAAHSNIPH